MRSRGPRWLIAVAAIVLAACGGSSQSPDLTLITINGVPTAAMTPEQSAQLTATATYSDGTTKDLTATVAWNSTDASVLTVAASGVITAMAAGQASVIATVAGASGLATVQVALPALFGSPVVTDFGGSPTTLAWADFNADGKVDLLFRLIYEGPVYIALGNGDGSFQPSHPLGSLSAIRSATVGDLNGDGKLDLAMVGCAAPTCALFGSLFVLLGNGEGSFQPPVAYPAVSNATALSIGDLDGDGRLDVAVGHDNKGVSVLLGNGDGTLQAPTDLPADIFIGSVLGAWGLAVADVNADGKKDLVVFQATGFFASISVLLGRGDGTFNSPLKTGVTTYPQVQVIADFNLDGRPDVAISGSRTGAQPGPGQLTILLSQGDGRLSSVYPACPDPFCYGAFAAGDLDGDGIPDLVVQSTGPLSILYGKGDGTFSTAQNFALSLDGSVCCLIDLNGDGRPDLMLKTSNGTAVLLNTQ